MKPKPFNFQVFRFHDVTKNEAVNILREEAEAGQSLSPEAMLILADIFDPNVDQRGRSFKKANFRLWEAAGVVYALWKHQSFENTGTRRNMDKYCRKSTGCFTGNGEKRNLQQSRKTMGERCIFKNDFFTL